MFRGKKKKKAESVGTKGEISVGCEREQSLRHLILKIS